jgi:cbb3-type cytochrome oxidase maturation protein
VESLYILIPIALVFCAIAIKLLLWAIDSGQYEDLDKEAWKILADDEPRTDATKPDGDGKPREQEQRP